MPNEIGRADVQRLLEAGAQLVDVLPATDYEDEHIAGAASLPLRRIDDDGVSRLDRSRPVVVYCFDSAWDLSPRAAWRLEALGFAEVYDYAAGRADWAAAGLPLEGRTTTEPRIGALAHREVVTCLPDEPLGDVRARVEASGLPSAVVTNEHGVVLGLLGKAELAGSAGARADAVMRPGPSTFRPNVTVKEMRSYMAEHDLPSAPVTSSDGRLIGLLLRDDVEASGTWRAGATVAGGEGPRELGDA